MKWDANNISLAAVLIAIVVFLVGITIANEVSLSAATLAPSQAIAAERDRLELEFAKHWSAYLLAKHGCPPLTTVGMRVGPEDCHAAQGEVLYGELDKARKLAAKVFELEPRRIKSQCICAHCGTEQPVTMLPPTTESEMQATFEPCWRCGEKHLLPLSSDPTKAAYMRLGAGPNRPIPLPAYADFVASYRPR